MPFGHLRPRGASRFVSSQNVHNLQSSIIRLAEDTGKSVSDLNERCRRAFRDAFEAGKELRVEYRLRRHDGLAQLGDLACAPHCLWKSGKCFGKCGGGLPM